MFIIGAIANIISQLPVQLYIIFPICYHKVKDYSLCLLERKKDSLFHEDVRMKLYVTLSLSC